MFLSCGQVCSHRHSERAQSGCSNCSKTRASAGIFQPLGIPLNPKPSTLNPKPFRNIPATPNSWLTECPHLAPLTIQVGHDDFGSIFQEEPGRREADPLRPAGDDGNLVSQHGHRSRCAGISFMDSHILKYTATLRLHQKHVLAEIICLRPYIDSLLVPCARLSPDY